MHIYISTAVYIYICVRCVVRSIGAPSTVACFRPVCWSSCRVIIKRRHRVRPHSHHRHYTVVSVDITAATAFTAIASATSAAEPLYRHLCIRRHHRPPPQRHIPATPARSFTSQPTQKYARITDLGARCLLLSHEYYSTAAVYTRCTALLRHPLPPAAVIISQTFEKK